MQQQKTEGSSVDGTARFALGDDPCTGGQQPRFLRRCASATVDPRIAGEAGVMASPAAERPGRPVLLTSGFVVSRSYAAPPPASPFSEVIGAPLLLRSPRGRCRSGRPKW
jgi:hypothetical protein